MKKYIIIILLLSFELTRASISDKSNINEKKCQSFVKVNENYKKANDNTFCLKAAEAGVGSAQYSVALGYGYSENFKLEKEYYHLAANNHVIGAYLALGHVLRKENPWEAIYWYQRYISS